MTPPNKAGSESLTQHAKRIWQAGVDAVRSDALTRKAIRLARPERLPDSKPLADAKREGQAATIELQIADSVVSLAPTARIMVVGAGKAGAGMARGVEQALEELDSSGAWLSRLEGWVNVPADCVTTLQRIHLHAARPAGVNEPTSEGVAGAEQILQRVQNLTAQDLCLVLLSGGGSALLPAPRPPLTLDDKQAVTRFLMHAGATINQLNTVRKRLSRIKGGNLARASRAGRLVTLIISDVVGDPLDVIASGPTVADPGSDADAMAILNQFGAGPPDVPQRVLDFLGQNRNAIDDDGDRDGQTADRLDETTVSNHVIGNNQTALAAAQHAAQSLGYDVRSLGSDNTGLANTEGRDLARRCQEARASGLTRPLCILSGGEPIVQLAKTDQPRKGGRNQQLVLAAIDSLWDGNDPSIVANDWRGMVLLSGGTDGEDGPTDAAGAWVDHSVWRAAHDGNVRPHPYLAVNNSYRFFESVGGLLKTGPTNTNVMDLRVALIEP